MSQASAAPAKPSSSRSRRDKDDTDNPDIHLPSIGNYVFQKTVGEGNFAKVKLAKHKLTGAEVAIKVIDKTKLDEKKLGKLYREVRIMKMLHHPHIVKLYEVIETKHTVFLVMEYASGGELYDYLVVHGKMKEKEARAKFRQILSAVSYCHKKRVIHRDLKAENLLLDSNLDIKIADFGFSNYYDPDSKLDTFCGSPPYAAPELFQGRRYTGPEVDVWSLGVILYVLTTGCLPFDGKNLQEMRESVCRGKYRIPFYLSDSCEKLLRKFLIRDPYKRAGLEILNDDPWINEGYNDSPISADLSQKVEEDENIIRIMEAKYHIDRETVLHSLRENIYDDVAAVYYLLYYEKEAKPTGDASGKGLSVSTSPSPPIVTVEHEVQSATAALPSQHSRAQPPAEPAMSRIEEDENKAVMAPGSPDVVPPPVQLRPAQKAKPKKRRFTVGGEADMAKFADEDEEAAEMLKKLQAPVEEAVSSTAVNAPATIATARGGGQPTQRGATGASTAVNTIASQSVNQREESQGHSSHGHGHGNGHGHEESQQHGGNAEEDQPQQRKRHNTIVGILRSHMRRPSDVGGIIPITSIAERAGNNDGSNIGSKNMEGSSDSSAIVSKSAIEDGKPRSLRFTFNSNTTSSKSPDEIISEVTKACDNHGISYRLTSRYLVECFWSGTGKDGVKFEVEVCKLPRLKNLHGLKFKRVGGSSSDYKDVCEKKFPMSAPPPRPSRPGKKEIAVVRALYAYQAQNPDELSFEEAGSLPVVTALLQQEGIQTNLKNKDNSTARDLAKTDDVAALLIQYQSNGAEYAGYEEDEDDD
ncbi:Map microtubule affinity-regulating kinase [Phlyctochytrium bullatum]|nr:Map microtubule affinity-regulating kinase [Phlyctochytrium bullatum]